MTTFPIRITAVLIALALVLTACTGVKPAASDNLAGTWYQNGGGGDLIWEFHTDGTVVVHSWTATSRQVGIYRHLNGDHVALDFGGDAASVVDITVAGNRMMMTNPNNTRTMLEKK